MFPNYFMEYFFLEIYGYVYEIQGENKECRYSNKCNCSYHGLVFIAWKYNEMNKSIVYTPPLPQGKGGGLSLQLNLTGPQLLEGNAGKEDKTFFRGEGGAFPHKV